jgi:hypothetical protein
MTEELSPVVGSWYKDNEGGVFEVVALDEDDNYVEIQYFGGEIDEIDFDAWESLNLETVAPPEDWSGPFDDLERDDLGYTDMNLPPDARDFSLEDVD